jgi:hypothetical protein
MQYERLGSPHSTAVGEGGRGRRSQTSMLVQPLRASMMAHARPVGPPPTTTVRDGGDGSTSTGLVLVFVSVSTTAVEDGAMAPGEEVRRVWCSCCLRRCAGGVVVVAPPQDDDATTTLRRREEEEWLLHGDCNDGFIGACCLAVRCCAPRPAAAVTPPAPTPICTGKDAMGEEVCVPRARAFVRWRVCDDKQISVGTWPKTLWGTG